MKYTLEQYRELAESPDVDPDTLSECIIELCNEIKELHNK